MANLYERVQGKPREFESWLALDTAIKTEPIPVRGHVRVLNGAGSKYDINIPDIFVPSGFVDCYFIDGVGSIIASEAQSTTTIESAYGVTITDNYIVVPQRPLDNSIDYRGLRNLNGNSEVLPATETIEEFTDPNNGVTAYKIIFDTAEREADFRNGWKIWLNYEIANFTMRGEYAYSSVAQTVDAGEDKPVASSGVFDYINGKLLADPTSLDGGSVAFVENGEWKADSYKNSKLRELVDESIFKIYSNIVLPSTGHKSFSFIDSYDELPSPTLTLMGVEIQVFGEEAIYRCVPTAYPPNSDDDMVWEIV
jgi:hypothetical protein